MDIIQKNSPNDILIKIFDVWASRDVNPETKSLVLTALHKTQDQKKYNDKKYLSIRVIEDLRRESEKIVLGVDPSTKLLV